MKDRPATAKERAASSRRTRAEAGEPLPHVFDKALREEVLRHAGRGTFEVDLPDQLEATTERLISSGHSRRGCATVVQRLMSLVGREAAHGA